MSLTVHTCSRCREELRVPDRYRGRELKCPKCGYGFTIPAASPAAEQRAGDPQPAARSAPRAAAAAPSGPSGLGGWLAVVIGWLMVVSLTGLYHYLEVREILADATMVRNLERLQSGQLLQYCRIVEVVSAFMVFAVVVALLSIFTYRRWARSVVVTVLALAIGLGVWDYVWVTQVFDESTRQILEIPAGAMDAYLAGRVLACGLALVYFLASTRVKNTFVK